MTNWWDADDFNLPSTYLELPPTPDSDRRARMRYFAQLGREHAQPVMVGYGQLGVSVPRELKLAIRAPFRAEGLLVWQPSKGARLLGARAGSLEHVVLPVSLEGTRFECCHPLEQFVAEVVNLPRLGIPAVIDHQPLRLAQGAVGNLPLASCSPGESIVLRTEGTLGGLLVVGLGIDPRQGPW